MPSPELNLKTTFSRLSISSSESTPTILSMSFPSLNMSIVGTPWTAYCEHTVGLSPTFSLATFSWSLYTAAMRSMMGRSMRQYAHHGAHIIRRTGPGENLAGEIDVRDIDGQEFPRTDKKGGMTAPAVKTIRRSTVFRPAFSTNENGIICIHHVEPFLQESLF